MWEQGVGHAKEKPRKPLAPKPAQGAGAGKSLTPRGSPGRVQTTQTCLEKPEKYPLCSCTRGKRESASGSKGPEARMKEGGPSPTPPAHAGPTAGGSREEQQCVWGAGKVPRRGQAPLGAAVLQGGTGGTRGRALTWLKSHITKEPSPSTGRFRTDSNRALVRSILPDVSDGHQPAPILSQGHLLPCPLSGR